MRISVRLDDNDGRLLRKYAKINDISISELVRRAVREKIEDECDLEAYDRAMKEYKADPAEYSHDEVRKALGLD